MTQADVQALANSQAVDASVYYANPSEEPLFWRQYPPAPGETETNIAFVEHCVRIGDARRSTSPFRLDVEGATFGRRRSAVRDFYDEEELLRVGYAEAADIAKTASGASQVFVFDHNLRRGCESAYLGQSGIQKPVFHVHTDFSAKSAAIRLKSFAQESAAATARAVLSAASASGRRFAVLNVWRPIVGPIKDSPLAICDAASSQSDLLPAALLYPERQGEIYYVKFNAAHRWWYLPDMQAEEVWIFKNYDSAGDAGRARFTPHTAFIESTDANIAPRQSVEFRTFAIF